MATKKPAAPAKKTAGPAKKPAAPATKAPAKKPEVKKPAPAAKPEAKKAEDKKPAPQTLFQHLCYALEIAPTAGESYVGFATRACEEMGKLTDAQYGTLSEPAQTWMAAAVEAINNTPAGKDVEMPAMPGFEPAAEGAAAAAAGGAATDTKGAAKPEKAAKAPKEPKAPKAPKEPAGPRATSSKKDSVAYKMRLSVVQNPAATFEDSLKAAGVDEERGGNAFNAWQNAKHVMAICIEEGVVAAAA